MKKVIVLGCLGMAGHVMITYLREIKKYQVFGVARSAGEGVDEVIDVTDFKALKSYLKENNPDYVINCVGALVSSSNENISLAILLNSYLPQFLAEVGLMVDYKLIHMSTDCVFSGKVGGYTEDSFRDGDTNYARTKALGEVNNERDLTIRTSIVGPEIKTNGTGLFDFFLKQRDCVQGYTKSLWSGITTLQLAKSIVPLIEHDVRGVYHLTNAETISKYALFELFKTHTQKNIKIDAVDGYMVNKSLQDTRKLLSDKIPSYDVMIEEMVNFMKQHPLLYSHYTL